MREWLRSTFGFGPSPGTGGAALRAQGRAAYESASTSRRTADWDPPGTTANTATQSADTIRRRCRDAYRNDPWAKQLIDVVVDDLVGWGVRTESRSKNPEFRAAVTQLHDDWSRVCDADGLLDLAGIQALVTRSWLVDGEVFVRIRPRLREDGIMPPLQVQVLSADCCPATTTIGAPEGHVLKDGIEFDRIGRRVAYHLRSSDEDTSGQLSRVPAHQVLHVYDVLRAGQRRGIPPLAAALVRLHELDKLEDAALLRLQLSNLFVGSIKRTGVEDSNLDALTGEPIAMVDGAPSVRLSPGAFAELGADEALEFNTPPAPPVGLDAFIKHQLRGASAALGVPYEVLSGDWGSSNDRLARVVLGGYRRRILRTLWTVLVPRFCRPLWEAWFAAALAAKALPVTDTYLDDRRGAVSFHGHAWPYIHPVQDITSFERAIRAGLTSRSSAVAEQGETAEDIDRENAADNARADALSLTYTSDGRQQNGGTR